MYIYIKYLYPDNAYLFIDQVKVSPEVTEYLNSQGVTVKPYNTLINHVKDLISTTNAKILIDTKRINYAIYR
jgi:hypothetical protein